MQSDFSALLIPISTNNPAGDNLEDEPLFDDIRDARKNDPDYLSEGDWSVSEPRAADWNQVLRLSETALREHSKDLQLACWYVEATCHLQGLEGLNTGIEFLSEFITRFWFRCWPALEEDGLVIRRSQLLRLDRELSLTLIHQPVLQEPISSLSKWRKILALEHTLNTQPDAVGQLSGEERELTMKHFDRLAARFSLVEIGLQAARLEKIITAIIGLEERYQSLSQDAEGPLFTTTRQTAEDLSEYLQRLTQRVIPKTSETILPAPFMDEELPYPDLSPVHTTPQMMNREQAVSQMTVIADYFRQSEPSSPVPFLMERAARWATMTLQEWLEEMLSDGNGMNEINNVLKGKHL